jgi:N-acetylmuramate 1-kinase
MSEILLRLEQFLRSRGQSNEVQSLTADASTREYYRIDWDGKSAVACVYPEPFEPTRQTFLDVTRLFLASGLPVADVMDFDGGLGIIIQEDLGDLILRDALADADEVTRETRTDEAIMMIARIQAATDKAFKMNSIASRERFDTTKLLWELNFFKEHYFETYLQQPLPPDEDASVADEFRQLSVELESRASVLCHRDYHAANLMIDRYGRMRIIDHQDARIGSPAYDLVSLLLDRVTKVPLRDWVEKKQKLLLSTREELGLEAIDPDEFAHEFQLQTIQRCLKAAGTFSYQSAIRGKTHFDPFIKPMFRAVLRAINGTAQFPTIKIVLECEINETSVN